MPQVPEYDDGGPTILHKVWGETGWRSYSTVLHRYTFKCIRGMASVSSTREGARGSSIDSSRISTGTDFEISATRAEFAASRPHCSWRRFHHRTCNRNPIHLGYLVDGGSGISGA